MNSFEEDLRREEFNVKTVCSVFKCIGNNSQTKISYFISQIQQIKIKNYRK